MKPQRVLVVDDESSIRDTLKRYLGREGHHVETAPNGAEALNTIEKAPFDVVITDLNMPRIGGVELIRRIKEAAPKVVTIVLTGYGTLDSAVAVLRQGCDDYLLKPVNNLGLITHAMERCLGRRGALTMAASARKVSEAKDNILELVVDDFDNRLAEFRENLGKLEQACTGNQQALAAVASMTAAVAQVAAMLTDARMIHRTLSERSVGSN